MLPISFRSAIVRYATEINKGTTIASIFKISEIIIIIFFKAKTGFEPVLLNLQFNTFTVMLFSLNQNV